MRQLKFRTTSNYERSPAADLVLEYNSRLVNDLLFMDGSRLVRALTKDSGLREVFNTRYRYNAL
jgi:hypothetical protein